ncbi:hypothetical protein BD413DRAFT_482264 [Trametes elegans]|nr:hypothetical protein BD413DRAFT_482264 [Trametes elegans]
MFRLPTHLETLVPPPGGQVPQSQPWRGVFFLPASSPHASAHAREIRVTAAETENDNSQQELWPRQFQLQIIPRVGILREVHAWLAQLPPGQLSRCMIMPDRLPDAAASEQNKASFEALARQLLDGGIVAVAPWSVTPPYTPGGLLLYPTTTTRALLVGIVFLNVGFPEFVVGPGLHSAGAGPSSRMPPHPSGQLLPRAQPFQPVAQHSPYDPFPPNIASTTRYGQGGLDPAGSRSGRHSG